MKNLFDGDGVDRDGAWGPAAHDAAPHAHEDARRYLTDEPMERVETLDDLIRRMHLYERDPARFAEESLWIQRPDGTGIAPLQLEDHQRDWLIAAGEIGADGYLKHKVCVASWPKREGKTLVVAIMVLWRMCTWENQRCIVLANSKEQATSNVFNEVLGFFRHSPALGKYVAEGDIQRRQITATALGNIVVCFPCNWQTVQGTAVTGVLAVDELHAVPDSRAYDYLRAQTERLNVQILISSQAGVGHEDNPVYMLYQARDEPHVFFSYSGTHLAPWAIKLAEQQKAEIVPSKWAHLHLNSWGGEGEKLFTLEQVEAGASDWAEPQSREEWLALLRELKLHPGQVTIGVGLDRAGVSRRGDRTVWTVIARAVGAAVDGQDLYFAVMCRVLPTGAEHEVLGCWRDTVAIFGTPGAVFFEAYGCGDIVEKVDGAELHAPTTQKQQTLFNGLWRVFNEARVGFPSAAGTELRVQPGGGAERIPGLLRRELIEFEHDASGGEGKVKFGTQTGTHDDTVYSLAWAKEASDSTTPNPPADEGDYAMAGPARKYGPRAR